MVLLCDNEAKAEDVFSFQRPINERLNEDYNGLCPNNKTKCSSSGTCCKTKHNSYHCCRFKHAVCCPDKYHCCPHGSTCNTDTKRCDKDDQVKDIIEWKVENNDDINVQQMMLLSKSQSLLGPTAKIWTFDNVDKGKIESEVMCQNNKTKCKDTKTCCITKHGNYYCCPHKNAVCCSDKWTCCPEGTTCDLENKKCSNTSMKFSIIKSDNHQLSELDPANTIGSVIEKFFSLFANLTRRCGNSQKQCSGMKKCCAMTGGKFGCCNYRKGVCCPDFATCCPHDTQCDVKSKSCTAVPENLVPVENNAKQRYGICPDKVTNCSSSETCCSVGKVLFGCCPMKDATCCSDKRSCCPRKKKCDLKHKKCINMVEDDVEEVRPIKTNNMHDMRQRKSLAIFLSKVGLGTICPDQGNCPGHETCCSIGNGRFGCCPYMSATCCADKRTCCPHNKQCLNGSCL